MKSPTAPELDFEKLPVFQKRAYVPESADLLDLAQVQGLYKRLLAQDIQSAKGLESWLLNFSELEAALDQAGSILYIRMTCQTDDEKRSASYQKFIETVIPAVKSFHDELNRKYLTALKKYSLNEERYGVLTRNIQADVELFIKENIALQTKEQLLSQEYQTVCGKMSVNFDGKEQTMPQMGRYLLEPDRMVREEAWRAIAKRRLQDKDKLEDIFDQMLALRKEIATNAHCRNYTEYKFRSLHRFDYTPADCKKYHTAIEKCVVPLWGEVLKTRKQQLKADSLRPWDTACDPLNRQPLKPFEKVSRLVDGCQSIFKKIDPLLENQFKDMKDLGLLDLESRKGKAPGGYQSALDEARKPFIFMNSVGVDDDVRTLLHECGHAFHSLACANDPLLNYRHGPMEFNEVASMAMELLGGEYIGEFYSAEDEKRSRQEHLEGIIYILAWVATVDSFQHWIYENPNHTRNDRSRIWQECYQRFGGKFLDWSGLQEEQAHLWHRQLHIFEVPFYYIEYGIAQLGALQLWMNAKKNWAGALAQYKHGLSLGGSKPLPEIYRQAGIRFDFSEQTIAPLVEAVRQELESL